MISSVMFERTSIRKKSTMKIHMLTHTKEKSHECEVCKKKFSRKHDLNAHIRIHTGDRPFGCDICFRRFTQRSNRNKHLRTHEKLQ